MTYEQNSLALLSSFNHYIGSPQTYNNNIFYDEIFFAKMSTFCSYRERFWLQKS